MKIKLKHFFFVITNNLKIIQITSNAYLEYNISYIILNRHFQLKINSIKQT